MAKSIADQFAEIFAGGERPPGHDGGVRVPMTVKQNPSISAPTLQAQRPRSTAGFAPARMKALRFEKYGPPSVLSLQELRVPDIKPGEALVELHASAVNPSRASHPN